MTKKASSARGSLPASLYQKILEAVPLVYADAIIVHRGKFLLIQRTIPPLKGYWLTPGGRLEKGEKLEDAIHREVREETGLRIRIKKCLGFTEYQQKLPSGITRHCVNFYYLAVPQTGIVHLNYEGKKAEWVSHIPRKCPPYQRRMLRKAGFR